MTHLRYRSRRLAIVAAGLAVLLPLAGCSSQFTYVPVKGKVTLKGGKPVTFGTVVFMPDKENVFKQVPSGKINSDGTYELTSEGKAGVPIGSYIACVRGPLRKVDGKDPPPLPFSMRYFDANESPLRVEVVANPADGAYDLELTSGD